MVGNFRHRLVRSICYFFLQHVTWQIRISLFQSIWTLLQPLRTPKRLQVPHAESLDLGPGGLWATCLLQRRTPFGTIFFRKIEMKRNISKIVGKEENHETKYNQWTNETMNEQKIGMFETSNCLHCSRSTGGLVGVLQVDAARAGPRQKLMVSFFVFRKDSWLRCW